MQCRNLFSNFKIKNLPLTKFPPYTIPGRSAPPKDAFIVASILNFRISHIVGAGRRGPTLAFLTRWDGYDSTHDS
jgi:hypothetical protein